MLILQASIDVALTTAALVALTWALRGSGSRWFLLSGVVLGLASLNRPNMALAAAGLAVVLLVMKGVRPGLWLAAGLLVGMAPVAVRNAIVADRWSPLSSHGGLNFYIGNHEAATGFYQQIPGITPDIAGQQRDAARVAAQALGRAVTEAEASDYFAGRALRWIADQPGQAAWLFVRKLGYTFNAHHVALPYSYPFYAYDVPTALRFYAVGPWLLIPLGLVGLVVLVYQTPVADRRALWIWIAFVPLYAASVAAFFVAERYRLPLLVPLCAGSGIALDALASAVTHRRWRALAFPGAAFALLFAASQWNPGLSDGRWDEGIRMAQRLVILDRHAEVNTWIERLTPASPRPGLPQYHVGLQYLARGDAARAVAYLSTAQRLDPGRATVEYGLGQALLKAGRPADAMPHLRSGFDAGLTIPLAGYDLALTLQQMGDLPGAADVIRRMSPSPWDEADVWLRLGRLASELKAPDVAEPFFRRGVALQPANADTRLQYGLNLLLLSRPDEARRELADAVRLAPRDVEARAHLALALLSLGEVDAAREQADAALALQPDHALARSVRAAVR